MSFISEFVKFLLGRKKYWLFPAIIILVLFSILFFLLQGSPLAPFVYTLF